MSELNSFSATEGIIIRVQVGVMQIVLLNLFSFSEKSYRFTEKSECLCQPNGWVSHLEGEVFPSFLLVSQHLCNVKYSCNLT